MKKCVFSQVEHTLAGFVSANPNAAMAHMSRGALEASCRNRAAISLDRHPQSSLR